jgi:non-canonical (house-cleaning) NTP pyrophosphatase
MIESIMNDGKEISEIAVDMGFAEHRDFRQWLWMVWVLTKSRVTRINYTYQSVQMALLHLENPEHY